MRWKSATQIFAKAGVRNIASFNAAARPKKTQKELDRRRRGRSDRARAAGGREPARPALDETSCDERVEHEIIVPREPRN